MTSRRRVLQGAAALPVVLAAGRALAAGFPTSAMKIVVPYPPGGPTDTLARLVSRRLGERWGQPVLVDYKPGAGTMIGVAHVAQAPADGLTIGIVNSAFVINPMLRKSVPYRVADLAPVTQLVEVPLVLAANPATPYDTLPELVAYAKKNPDKMNFGTPGAGGTSHLAGELLNRVAGIRLTHIAYKGSAPAHTDLIGGQVPLIVDPLLSVQPHARAGRMKVIAVLSSQRVKGAEQFPTVAETYPGFEVSTFLGLVTPTGTPKEAVDTIHQGVADVLSRDDDRTQIEELGMFAKAQGPVAFGRLLAAETSKWESIIREQDIRVD